jgi:hypothetical protein
MQTVTVEGKQVRFWDFGRSVEKDGTKVAEPGYVAKESQITVQKPEKIDECLAVANGDESRLCELVFKGLEAEAEDRAGETPAGTFSNSMIQAADKAFKASPQFSGVKSSKDRKEAIMKWISTTPGLKDSMLAAFESLRNVKNKSDEDSE